MKNYLGFVAVALFAIMLGCGGGGGGGGSSDGTTNGCTIVSFTAGQTNAQAGDTIYGQVIDNEGCPKANINVRLYTAGNVLQGTATTNVDGYWRANVGTNTTKADVDGATVNNTMQKGFTYGNAIFQAATTNPPFDCKVPLPSLTVGVLKPMTNQRFIFQLAQYPPLPPPTGCQP